MPVGEPGEPYGHREQSCTQVHEQQKAPSDAAGAQKAGFDGSSRWIRGLQGLELGSVDIHFSQSEIAAS